MLAWRAVKDRYTEEKLAGVLASVPRRSGWDFSGMRDLREPVPWDYPEVAARYLRAGDEVLDVGTGGGEQFGELAACFGRGLGIDVDPAMVDQARRAAVTSSPSRSASGICAASGKRSGSHRAAR
jgi:SAM-dependent methyltransferase